MSRRMTNTDPALRHGWHPVALSTELGDGPLGVRLLGEPWVLARPDGVLTAFEDRCPHRLAPLSAGKVEGATLVCPYHGWRFASDGNCVAVPALGPGVPAPRRARARRAWGVTERHGLIWLAPDEPFSEIMDLPEETDDTFDSVWLDPARTTAAAGLLADNFLDTAHFPFVHSATIGAGEDMVVPPYRVEADGDGFRVTMEQEVANPEDPGVAAGLRPLVQRRVSTYVFRPPFMLRLRMEYPDACITNTIHFCLQPEDDGATRVYTRLLRDDLGADPARLAAAARFEQAVLDEDLALQERFTIDGLPLISGDGELAEEVSIRADAAGVALRRVLAAFVTRAGRYPRHPGFTPVEVVSGGSSVAGRRPVAG
ncbi:aromatic ring-hydroxylating dioxygenase subunit alpha [Frankia sp. CNm7]|uniref:Aromatic ring-hydroxylating dioxygenase subunit alpha n=1 Tax=Frankia nepalensis TaxID=1836974 RepID=A0A937RQ54_9ACTN|nr:aromatic ring-hydroxylating dioxygenase subunit alpha [Frankia nepalensis]MBL7495504.1 aromatic ring-hydroxylating dioxygenase subunit alpha [Frankia nepalensis]MBL7510873.1 aromatic ring-hydroxylating dioxygenase subunit alpha [Frankia nepalensis]MBL7520406.1 aromatic ring-hydroxylating dioxygenase subunit alpha [Frankia nepalensis]MBL7630608.1 aromatic ring-hydroxylating dioxygenase subunit alpha [Frankia nepalensis]